MLLHSFSYPVFTLISQWNGATVLTNILPFISRLFWCVCFLVKVKGSRYWSGVAQRVGRHIALLFHDRGTRRGLVVSSTPRPHFTPGKDSVSILQEAGWAPGPVLTGGKSRPHRDSIPDRPARSQSLHRLSYLAHVCYLKEQYREHTQEAADWYTFRRSQITFSIIQAQILIVF